MANAILDAAAHWDGPIPGRDRVRIVCAGAPPPTKTIERIETELGWEFIQIYGLTETTPLLTMNRGRAEYDDLSPADGPPSSAAPARRRSACRCASRPDGEVLARGNHIMAGYWEQPEATADAIHAARDDPSGPEWFHTGDGGIIDDDWYVTISDRKKDVIITGGENVSSIEVEDAIFSHPDVAEVAVIGVPDEKWGELVMALVVTTPGSDAHRGRRHRLHQDQAGRLQVPEAGRVPRVAGPHRHRQAAEVQAARALLARCRQERQLSVGIAVRST